MQTQNLLFLYDLPKDLVTSNALKKAFKEKAGYDLTEPPQIRRHPEKIFYTAIVKINDNEKFKEVCKSMKYFKLENMPCRALPFDRELQGANRQNLTKQNIFLKKIPANLTSEEVEKLLSEKFGIEIKSCKVSINPDYSSRGYGFALFMSPDDATKAIEEHTL
jgi:hypothetical protein